MESCCATTVRASGHGWQFRAATSILDDQTYQSKFHVLHSFQAALIIHIQLSKMANPKVSQPPSERKDVNDTNGMIYRVSKGCPSTNPHVDQSSKRARLGSNSANHVVGFIDLPAGKHDHYSTVASWIRCPRAL